MSKLFISRIWQFVIKKQHNDCVHRMYSNRNILRLSERGMFEDIFPEKSSGEIIDLLNGKPQRVYAGFDPTAHSLHIGNLLVLINLLHWQRAGHKVIALVGGATGRIGDPSGHNSDRPQLETLFVDNNVKSIGRNILQIFENHENLFWKKQGKEGILSPPKIVNNLDWYLDLNVVDFVSRIGRHFRLGTMLSRESVQSRMTSEEGMSFTEFCYQVFQAYDWLHLLRKYECRFQIGGSDQMGNIVSGHNLVSRAANIGVYGLTLPIVTTESGNKFGKTAGNALWLTGENTSAFELYQFFVRCRDSEVERYLKLFTFDSVGSIQDLMKSHQKCPEERKAQKRLAEQVTLLIHGEAGLQSALKATSAFYNQSLETLSQLNDTEIDYMFRGAKTCEMLMQPGTTVLDLALKAGCFPNEREALRIISAGGFYINHQRVTNIEEVLTTSVHILPSNITLIRVGKKNYFIVRWAK